MSYNILAIFPPVGPIGSGKAGGVELTVVNFVKAMNARGHRVSILAPSGSVLLGADLIEVPGQLHRSAEVPKRHDPETIPVDSVLGNMLSWAREREDDYDVILNFAYDWLPYYLTSFFSRPFLHFANMSSYTDIMDDIIKKTVTEFPGVVAVQTKAQAESFGEGLPFRYVNVGIDLSLYEFRLEHEKILGWAGRIIPGKGLEDVFKLARRTSKRVRVMGAVWDLAYWNSLTEAYQDVSLDFLGFLATADFQKALGECEALLMPSRYIESFGNVVIEAFACGVPVVTYDRGAPPELVVDGVTGFVVCPDDLDELVLAVSKIPSLDRREARLAAEERFSLTAMADSFESWFKLVV